MLIQYEFNRDFRTGQMQNERSLRSDYIRVSIMSAFADAPLEYS